MNWVVRNWLIAAAAVAALTALGSFLEAGGLHAASALLLLIGWGAVGILALIDGVLRALGQPALLGPSRGFGRVLALAQILLAILLLLGLVAPFL